MTEPISPQERRTRQRVLEQAIRLLGQGFRPGVLADATRAAGCEPATAEIFFRRDADLIVALHERLAADFEARAVDLPIGTLGQRFAWAMRARLEQVAPYRSTFTALMALFLDRTGEHGVLSLQTESVRTRIEAVFAAVVTGARNSPPAPVRDGVIRTLYAGHLALLLLWTQDDSPERRATITAIELARDLLDLGVPFMTAAPFAGITARIETVLAPWVDPAPDPAHTERAVEIARELFRHRRLLPDAGTCATEPCAECIAIHAPRLRRFIGSGQPIHCVLPAFPAKSPNLHKVLGPSPDTAEELALAYLGRVCEQIKTIYSPGMRITICRDGHVFSDLVGVTDSDVARYGSELARMMSDDKLSALDSFSMEDLLDVGDYEAMRRHLCEHYAEPLAVLEHRTKEHPHHKAMWNGIQRFLFEDRVATVSGESRTHARGVCGELAYQVILRSNAWTRVVAECFPTALRLSIHPQPPHSHKIGIRLGDAEDAWLTPWHGVALRRGDLWSFVKRDEAEQLGARLIERDGRPMHFEIGGRL